MALNFTIETSKPIEVINNQILKIHDSIYVDKLGFEPSFSVEASGFLAEFTERFDKKKDTYLVAKFNGDVAGSVIVDSRTELPDVARLRLFAVDEKYQKNGIGKQLLAMAINLCKNNQLKGLYLLTFSILPIAGGLYESKGFTFAGVEKINYWGRVLDEKRYELSFA